MPLPAALRSRARRLFHEELRSAGPAGDQNAQFTAAWASVRAALGLP